MCFLRYKFIFYRLKQSAEKIETSNSATAAKASLTETTNEHPHTFTSVQTRSPVQTNKPPGTFSEVRALLVSEPEVLSQIKASLSEPYVLEPTNNHSRCLFTAISVMEDSKVIITDTQNDTVSLFSSDMTLLTTLNFPELLDVRVYSRYEAILIWHDQDSSVRHLNFLNITSDRLCKGKTIKPKFDPVNIT